MSIIRRTLFALVLLGLLPLLGGNTFPLVWRAFPQTSGSCTVAGLESAVDISRDAWGVPHVKAETEHDLFFAQGYVHAQDRLWQMDHYRRIGAGRQAEIFGADALAADRWMRTLGLHRAAQREWQALPQESQVMLQAYTDGVNAYISQCRGRLPSEFSLLEYEPEPWSPVDSLVTGKVIAFAWDSRWEEILIRGELVLSMGERAADLIGEISPPSEYGELDSSYSCSALLQDWRAAQTWLGAWGRGVGSSAWAVDGAMTGSGKPLLAGDVHLAPSMPSPWYEVHLTCGTLDVVGASTPGLPGVWMGHNQGVAWSIVNGKDSNQDVFLERVNPDNPDQVEFQGRWEDMDVRIEEIRVRGMKAPDALRVRSTRHGPLLASAAGGVAIALQWGGADGAGCLSALTALSRVRSAGGIREAVASWAAPAVGLLYADVEGNIGWQQLGYVPNRTASAQSIPLPGWTGTYEWNDYGPQDPSSEPGHGAQFIVCANGCVAPGPSGPVGDQAYPSFRLQRIQQQLEGSTGLSVEHMRAIQSDVASIPSALFAERALSMPDEGWLWERAVNFLRGWNAEVEVPSGGAALAELGFRRLLVNTFADDIWPRQVPEECWTVGCGLMARIIAEPDNAWFDDVRTAQRETRDDMISKSLHEAMDFWAKHRGDLVGNKDSQWGWGQEHTITFAHPAATRSFWLGLLFSRGPIMARGSWDTIAVAEWEMSHLKVQRAASYRQILDLGEWGNSRSGHTTGQSGHVLHQHYADMLDDWHAVRPHAMLYSSDAIQARTESLLRLLP